MKMFEKIAIVGTGLIGGSIALSIKEKKLSRIVIGISRHEQSLKLAKKIKAINAGSTSLDILKDADLVILATPVSIILKLAPQIAKIIRPDCIVCDVGSTKTEIVSALDKIFLRFVGTHPLFGSEKRGIKNAKPGTFKGRACIITPTSNTDKEALTKINKFFLKLGFKTIFMSKENHDRALSFNSHLPHLAAFSLINSVPLEYLKFAPPSLRETTRIAASDPQLWSDIFSSNKKSILTAVDTFLKNLSSMRSFIKNNNKSAIYRVIANAQRKRKALK